MRSNPQIHPRAKWRQGIFSRLSQNLFQYHQPLPDDAPLPALPLRDTYLRYRWWAASAAVALYIFLGLAIWGAIMAFGNRMPLSPDKIDFCEAGRSEGTERWFLVDTHIAPKLTFGQVKVIDLVWHGVAGQMGRLLHGWIFYQVVTRNVTWIAERFAIPYDVLIDLSFSPTQPTTLLSIGRMILEKTHKQLTIKMLWLMFLILYVLIFPTVWGGATGYISSSVASYEIPSLNGAGNYVTAATDLFNLCWVADLEPIGRDANTVIPGPLLSELHDPTTKDKSFRSMMSDFPNYSNDKHEVVKISDEFLSIYTYAMTKATIEAFFKPRHMKLIADTYYGGPEKPSSYDARYDYNKEKEYGPRYSDHDGTPLIMEKVVPQPCRGFATRTGMEFKEDDKDCKMVYPPYLVDIVVGWVFVADEHLSSGKFAPSQYVTARHSDSALNWNSSSLVLGSEIGLALGEFVLDPSARQMSTIDAYPLGQLKSLPYNSSLWWGNRYIDVPAPFLTLGVYEGKTCSWFGEGNHPICLCQNNTPMTDNFLFTTDKDKVGCLSNDDYVWGFVSYILLVGIILEVIWLWSCAILWYLPTDSQLVLCGRDGSGNIRRMLDIAPMIIQELGDSTGPHSEKQLRRRLQDCDPVGYVIEEKGELAKIEMRGLRRGLEKKRTLQLSPDKLYS